MTRHERPSAARDRGSATLWILAGCLLLLLAGLAVTLRTAAVLARHRAESAADLAALAAAGRIGTGADPCAGARQIAVRNGARLLACRAELAPDGRSGTVSVRAEVLLRLPLVGERAVSASALGARTAVARSDG